MSQEPVARQSVIIASTPRSGSYLLCDLLQATGHLPLADEWLTEVGLDRLRMAYGLPAETPLEALVPKMLKREQNDAGRFALKTVWEQFRETVQTLTGAPMEELPKAAREVFPNPKYLWIRRRDRLGQCISWVKAEQTGQWRRGQKGETADEEAPLLFSAHEIFRHRVFLHLAESGWADFFDHSAERPFIVYYEDLVADPDKTMKAICAFLDLPAPPPVTVPGKPQRDAVNADWKARFEALEKESEKEGEEEKEKEGEEDFRGRILAVPDRLEMQPGAVRLLSVEVRNDSNSAWVRRLTETGFRGAVARIEGLDREAIRGESHALIEPGEGGRIALRLVAPNQPGTYTLRWGLQADAVAPLADPEAAPRTVLTVTDAPEVAAAKAFFGGYAAVSTGWCELPWLGYFLDGWFPWIYHQEHRWWFIDDDGWQDGAVRIHDVHLGWLRTSPTLGPTLRREADCHELRLVQRSGESRTFENLTTDEPIIVPTCLYAHITNKDPREEEKEKEEGKGKEKEKEKEEKKTGEPGS